MTFDDRTKPYQIRPMDASGTTLPVGLYLIKVIDDGVVDEFYPTAVVVPLPPGSDATDVPAGTPDRSLIIIEA